MEDVGIFYGHLVYFTVIWYILWYFGIFFPFWYVAPRKIWHPWHLSADLFYLTYSQRGYYVLKT
jgi:hypothetical protein